MGIENYNLPRPPSIAIKEAYERAEKVLADSIDPREFSDLYKDVDRDIEWVNKMDQKFRAAARENPELGHFKMLAKAFEAVLYEQAEQSDWFGPDAVTIRTSRYDDYKNGVDSVVEFEEGESKASHLALAIDVTTSSHLRDKLWRIRDEINQGHLAEVKYFKSDRLNIRGQMTNIPRVIIGAQKSSVLEVINYWLNREQSKLAKHPIQLKILKETEIQLDAFQDYSLRHKQPELAAIYGKAKAIIDDIMANKKPRPKELEEIENDEVFHALQAYVSNFKQV